MNIKQATTDLEQFRESLYQNLENRADTLSLGPEEIESSIVNMNRQKRKKRIQGQVIPLGMENGLLWQTRQLGASRMKS